MKIKNKITAFILTFAMAITPIVSVPAIASADAGENGEVGVFEGSTPIFEGMAVADDDITIYNDQIALSFAVGSNNYWNMTKGSILDIGVNRGEDLDVAAIKAKSPDAQKADLAAAFDADLTNDVEFLSDLWTSTGEYQGKDLRTEDVEVSYDFNDDESAVTVTSKFKFWVKDADKDGTDDNALPLEITQKVTLEAGNNYASLYTTVKNPNESIDYNNMYSGYSISTNAAYMFGPYGLNPEYKCTGIDIGEADNTQEYFGKFVATYKDNYAVTLQMDETNAYKGSTGYKDLYTHQDLKAGETYGFTGELLVSDENETASIMDRWADRDGFDEDLVEISGAVKDAGGNPVEGVFVIAKKTGVYGTNTKSGAVNGNPAGSVVDVLQPLVWDVTDEDGEYSFNLPKTGWNDGMENVKGNGDYTYALKVEGAGYTSQQTELESFTEDTVKDFTIEKGAPISLKAEDQNGKAIPFRVEFTGVTYENLCAGVSTYFSDSANGKKDIEFNLSKADNVKFVASYGKNYESDVVEFETPVTETGVDHTFVIDEVVNPEDDGWFTMDNHQHCNFGDGATEPNELFNAQIAAKLDFNLVSDHDSRINNGKIAEYAEANDRLFISNEEVSPGWGHWGVLGVNFTPGDGSSIVDATTAKPTDIIAAGKDNNAIVIVHHPYSDYGYLNNQKSVAGGNEEGWQNFDLLELQSTMDFPNIQDMTAEDYESIDLEDLSATVSPFIDQSKGLTVTMDEKCLMTAFKFWNEGIEKYLSAGSDQHQATSTMLYPGIIREYAKMDSLSVENYREALLAGKAYVTMGPLFFPADEQMFGSTVDVSEGVEVDASIDVQAVNGASKVWLYVNGVLADTADVSGTDRTTADLAFTPDEDTVWYSYVQQDANGLYAVSNPIWVNNLDEQQADQEEALADAEAAVAEAETKVAEAEAAVEALTPESTEAEQLAAYKALAEASQALAEAQEAVNEAQSELTATLEKKLAVAEAALERANEKAAELAVIDITNYGVTLDPPTAEWTGEPITPAVAVNGLTSNDFDVAYASNTDVGTAAVTITAKGDKYKGTINASFEITKAEQTISKVTPTSKKVKAKKGKVKKNTTVALKATTTGDGAVTFKKANKVGKNKIKVAKNGKITVKKGLKKGTYKVKVKVDKAETATYKAATKTVTVKIVVK